MRIAIKAHNVNMQAELADTPAARAIFDKLPIESTVNTWGDEIYFSIPVDLELDDTASEVVEMGELGYWPTGKAFCIFFGATPISGPGEIRPASAVNRIGRVLGEPAAFKEVPGGTPITLSSLENI
jgi:hypothetical protein